MWFIENTFNEITGRSAVRRAKNRAPTPVGLRTGGLSADVTKGVVDVTRSPELQGILKNLKDTSLNTAGELGALKSQLRPGFGALTESAVSNLENRRRRAIGNLRENLARRRVAGSSFGQDTLARAEAEFAKQEADIRAQTKLQEIDATNKLILQEGAAKLDAFNVLLSQSNIEAQLGANMAAGVANQLQSNYRTITELEAANAQATGQLIGTGIGIAATSGQ